MRRAPIAIAAWLLASASGFAQPAGNAGKVIADIDLTAPFAARTPHRLLATQAPDEPDPIVGGTMPGRIVVCLRSSAAGSCDSALKQALGAADLPQEFTDPHYLNRAMIVYPKGSTSPPILFVQTSSMRSGDGGQDILTQALAYDRVRDAFRRIYQIDTGSNENEEVRFIAAGPLRGDIISAVPTSDAPYGYWLTVNALTPGYAYRQVLRYRSATHYGDGNPLAVIDSEMPGIERRLGKWRAGQPPPLPESGCPHPHLVHGALWCH